MASGALESFFEQEELATRVAQEEISLSVVPHSIFDRVVQPSWEII